MIDADTRELLLMVEGRESAALASFAVELERDGGSVAQIELIAMDMSPAYIKGARQHFPQARIVFDRVHVMLMAGRAFEKWLPHFPILPDHGLPQSRQTSPQPALPLTHLKQRGGEFVKYGLFETDGWNSVRVEVRKEGAKYYVNGHLVNQLTNPETKQGGKPLTEGLIGLQAEGAEVTYRNILIRPAR